MSDLPDGVLVKPVIVNTTEINDAGPLDGKPAVVMVLGDMEGTLSQNYILLADDAEQLARVLLGAADAARKRSAFDAPV